jgi:3-oxoacyl-(acyl-carrier-protein) synthase
MAAYILSSGVISPQETAGSQGFPDKITEVPGNRLRCAEPEYRGLIPPVQLRRMPRILKMGLAAAQLCLNRAGNASPDAIIVGTGLGCLESLEKFLTEVLTSGEHLTSVLPFINSTHNAVAAQIAMLLQNHGYNLTYCHRALSFESALADALMHLEEKQGRVLVGGIDECTDDFIKLHGYLNYWKEADSNLAVLNSHEPGTIAGEGSAFFMLSDSADGHEVAAITDVRTFFTPNGIDAGTVEREIRGFLEVHGLSFTDIGVFLTGINGDPSNDKIYHDLINRHAGVHTGVSLYKHLCGAYYTASAFGLWLATVILEGQQIPAPVSLKPAGGEIRHLLMYNHHRNEEHALILLSYGI